MKEYSEYSEYIAAGFLIFAAYILIRAIRAAYMQGKEEGHDTLFPTPAYGVVASFSLTYGLGFLHIDLPWWGFRMVFPGTTLLFPAIIYLVGRRSARSGARSLVKPGQSPSIDAASARSEDLSNPTQ
jgi:hypothetical protein